MIPLEEKIGALCKEAGVETWMFMGLKENKAVTFFSAHEEATQGDVLKLVGYMEHLKLAILQSILRNDVIGGSND